MAVLSPLPPDGDVPEIGRRRWARFAGLAALLCLAGCLLSESFHHAKGPLTFSHRAHLEGKAALQCADCHPRWDEEDDPGMPSTAQCSLCHDQLDDEKPPERHASVLFDGDQVRATHAGAQTAEISFSHKSHATRGLDCTACHADLVRDDGTLADPGADWKMNMDTCVSCHESSTGPALSDCASCHVEIRVGVPPPNHRAEWMRYHGSVARSRSSERTDQCALCHQPSSCVQCHNVQMPENHNNYWRRRGHGLTATMDRAGCMTCHESDSCRRCHEEIRPQSHVGSWGAPQDRHCVSCHEPLRGQSCAVCHDGTPSHDQATPMPPDHTPAMNCRMCHGNGQPLPHVDNGQSCTSCHH
jgi:hypothetical protein